MKIGTMVIFDDINRLESKFKRLKNFGLCSCQLSSWNTKIWTEDNARRINDLVHQYDIEISAFWCGWDGPRIWDFYDGQLTLGLVPVEYRNMRIKNLCDGADFAASLGIKDVATHMGFIPENPNDPNFSSFCVAVRTVAEHLKKNNQYLLFETGQETPVTLLRCFERVGTDNLGVNLDTANLILYGKANPVDALDVFGKYVRNIHAKDGRYPTNGHDLGEETVIGEGKVDFHGLFVKLHELGYDSWVTIEREVQEGSALQMKDISNSIAYLDKIIKEVYNK